MDHKYYITDYDLMGCHKLGIFSNGNRIFFNHKENLGINNYTFIFRISIEDKEEFTNIKNPLNYEIIKFDYRCNLNNFKKHWTLPKWMQVDDREDRKKVSFDCEKLMAKACPDLLNYLQFRLDKKQSNEIPPRVASTNSWPGLSYEFLQFTAETACNWGGPIRQDDDEGACLKVKIKEQLDIQFPIIDVKKQFRYYQCPTNLKQKLDSIAKEKDIINGDHYMFPMTPEEKEILFNTFSRKEQHDIFKAVMTSHIDRESIERILPYSIYICGNDDCSYSKWFATEEEVNDELYYLRKMQPLDFNRDIIDRDYIFTN